MNDKFNRIKKEIKIKQILIMLEAILFVGVGIGLCFINMYFLLLGFLLALIGAPVILMINKTKFHKLRDELTEEVAISNQGSYEAKLEPAKNHEINDFHFLGVDRITIYFYVLSTLEAKKEGIQFESYGVRFKDTRKKTHIGRVYHFILDSKEDVNPKGLSAKLLKHDSEFKVVKANKNEVFIFIANRIKGKNGTFASLEPQDFNTFEDFNNRMKCEFELADKVLELVKK